MRHRVKKIKFKRGKDSQEATLKKLVSNFLLRDKLTTTVKKAKILRSSIDRLVYKAISDPKNTTKLMKELNDRDLVDKLLKNVVPSVSERKGGYVRIIKLGQRKGDGSATARVEWVVSVVKVEEKKEILKVKTEIKAKKVKDGKSNKINKINKGKRR